MLLTGDTELIVADVPPVVVNVKSGRSTPVTLSLNVALKVTELTAPFMNCPVGECRLMELTVGTVLSKVKVIAVPVKVFPALSVAFAWTVYVVSTADDQVGSVPLLVHEADVLLVVAT